MSEKFDRDKKLLVWTRDEGHCGWCGTAVWEGDIHHRRGRGMGGRDSHEPWINGFSNLILLCREHHNLVERDIELGRSRGFRLGAGEVPDEVPVLCWDRVKYILSEDLYKTAEGLW